VTSSPDALIELVVPDETVAAVIQALAEAGRNEPTGHGHVSVVPLEYARNTVFPPLPRDP
jgi:nitrogen regulatory protein PII